MRILYGVVGEGMGHAMRSRVVIDHLVASGHEVEVVVSGRAHDYLAQRISERLGVSRIWGLSIVYEDNAVRNFRTLLRNVRGAFLSGGWPENIRAYFNMTEKFAPDVVISDFESWSWLFARNHGLPVISLDNIQLVNRCAHAPEILEDYKATYRLTQGIVKSKIPGAFHYLVTTFFYPPVRKSRTTLHPPVLRPEILSARPAQGDHLLVYQTSTSYTELPAVLKQTGLECRIYGLRRDIGQEEVDGPLRYRPFDEKTFIDDLRTAKGVVSGGSFTLMSEAVYLHRPMLSVPVKRQFEQVLNARYLEREGYGMYAPQLSKERIGAFLERLPDYARSLQRYGQDGNSELFAALDDALARAVRRNVAAQEIF